MRQLTLVEMQLRKNTHSTPADPVESPSDMDDSSTQVVTAVHDLSVRHQELAREENASTSYPSWALRAQILQAFAFVGLGEDALPTAAYGVRAEWLVQLCGPLVNSFLHERHSLKAIDTTKSICLLFHNAFPHIPFNDAWFDDTTIPRFIRWPDPFRRRRCREVLALLTHGAQLPEAAYKCGQKDFQAAGLNMLLTSDIAQRAIRQDETRICGIFKYAFPEVQFIAWRFNGAGGESYFGGRADRCRDALITLLNGAHLPEAAYKCKKKDFEDAGLITLLHIKVAHDAVQRQETKICGIFKHAFPEIEFIPWLFSQSGGYFADHVERERAALLWFEAKEGMDWRDWERCDDKAYDVTKRLKASGLDAIIRRFGFSVRDMLFAIFPERDYAWWRIGYSGYFQCEDHFRVAFAWLERKLEGRPYRMWRQADFVVNDLCPLLLVQPWRKGLIKDSVALHSYHLQAGEGSVWECVNAMTTTCEDHEHFEDKTCSGFTCHMCSKIFPNIYLLESHRLRHTEKGRQRQQYDSHRKAQRVEGAIVCASCGFATTLQSRFDRHQCTTGHLCVHCGSNRTSAEDLIQHQEDCHTNMDAVAAALSAAALAARQYGLSIGGQNTVDKVARAAKPICESCGVRPCAVIGGTRGGHYTFCLECQATDLGYIISRLHKGKQSDARGLEYEFDTNSLLDLLVRQRGRCAYSDLPLTLRVSKYSSREQRSNYFHDWQLSLERLDNTKGYISGNVVFVALEFNVGGHVQWSQEKIRTLRESIGEEVPFQAIANEMKRELAVGRQHSGSSRFERKYVPATAAPNRVEVFSASHQLLHTFPTTAALARALNQKFDTVNRHVRHPIEQQIIQSWKQFPSAFHGTYFSKNQHCSDALTHISCTKCGLIKAVEEFHRFRRPGHAGVGLGGYCKACRNKCKYTSSLQFLRGVLGNMVGNSKTRGHEPPEFGLKELIELYERQQGRCSLSGRSMTLARSIEGTNADWRLSAERLDDNVGYTLTNTVLICAEFNTLAKWTPEKVQSLITGQLVDNAVLDMSMQPVARINGTNEIQSQCRPASSPSTSTKPLSRRRAAASRSRKKPRIGADTDNQMAAGPSG